MQQNVPKSRRKLSNPTIIDRVTFALQARFFAMTRRDSWSLMSASFDATVAPLSPKPCR